MADEILRIARIEAEAAPEEYVEYLPEAQHFFQKRRIHERRVIPDVVPGDWVEDLNPTAALALSQPFTEEELSAMEAVPAAAARNIVITRNTPIPQVAARNTSSHVGEPSVATNNDIVWFTGNWYAAISTNGGATFQYINPYRAFPNPPGMQFCCDQVAHYIPSIDMFVWLLQYDQDTTGKNIQRLAFATTADMVAGRWRRFDITPAMLGFGNDFLDFPDIAVGTNMLYITTNVFHGKPWIGTVILRIPLSTLVSGSVTAQHATSTTNFNFRVTQNCGTTAFWGTHQTTSILRIFEWPESAAAPVFHDVPVASWVDGKYSSITPDGRNWLGRADRRLTGATLTGDEGWFGWTANAGGANNRPEPYIQIAQVDLRTFTIMNNLNIWDPTAGTAYPALNTNSDGEVGIAYFRGGGPSFVDQVAGILTPPEKHVVVQSGVRGPIGNDCGDYLTVRRHHPDGRIFSAAGFTLQAGTGTQDATPHFVAFRRQ